MAPSSGRQSGECDCWLGGESELARARDGVPELCAPGRGARGLGLALLLCPPVPLLEAPLDKVMDVARRHAKGR